MIDFRSDTVTRPCPTMRRLMADAEVGDDVWGDDPTVNRLEAYAAERMGKEAALYCSSGTQANLAGILAHCGRGDEYICGQHAHNYRYEAGGAAVLGSVQPQPVANREDGSLDLDDVAAVVKPDDPHFARSRLLSLENTFGGKVLPLGYIESLGPFAAQHGLGLHLDGARVFNAIVRSGADEVDMVRPFDTFTICLSKGLGAPVGSLLLGSAELVGRARRIRKILGGAMRQAGILASAGLYALEHNVQRLAEDHDNAEYLAQGLAAFDELDCDPGEVQTNIVNASCRQGRSQELADFLEARGILIAPGETMRFVTHLDVDRQGVDELLRQLKAFYKA